MDSQEVCQNIEEWQGEVLVDFCAVMNFLNVFKHPKGNLGVCRHHHNGRWEARIGRVYGNKYLYLGTYGH